MNTDYLKELGFNKEVINRIAKDVKLEEAKRHAYTARENGRKLEEMERVEEEAKKMATIDLDAVTRNMSVKEINENWEAISKIIDSKKTLRAGQGVNAGSKVNATNIK